MTENNFFSVKKTPTLCKLSAFYEELPEENLDGIDTTTCFYHNFFDISQLQHRKVRITEAHIRVFYLQVVPIRQFKATEAL